MRNSRFLFFRGLTYFDRFSQKFTWRKFKYLSMFFTRVGHNLKLDRTSDIHNFALNLYWRYEIWFFNRRFFFRFNRTNTNCSMNNSYRPMNVWPSSMWISIIAGNMRSFYYPFACFVAERCVWVCEPLAQIDRHWHCDNLWQSGPISIFFIHRSNHEIVSSDVDVVNHSEGSGYHRFDIYWEEMRQFQ